MPLSVIALVLANLVPLLGSLAFGWSAYELFALYWTESLVVGGYTILRFFSARPGGVALPWPAAAGMTAFFCIHYGLFLLVHGAFVQVLVGAEGPAGLTIGFDTLSPRPLLATAMHSAGGFGLLALVVSHGVSYATNFLRGGERTRSPATLLMLTPYARIVPMHLTLIAGGFLAMLVGRSAPMLALLVVAKTIADVVAHRREHRAAVVGPSGPASAGGPV